MKKLIIILLLSCLLSGCNLAGTAYYSDEELVVTGGVDEGIYTYSDKVSVELNYSGRIDFLKLKVTDKEDWKSTAYCALEGEFTEAAWNDNKIFIHTDDNVYHVFDVKNYQVGKFTSNSLGDKTKTPVYSLVNYTEIELSRKYPDYKTFEWYDH